MEAFSSSSSSNSGDDYNYSQHDESSSAAERMPLTPPPQRRRRRKKKSKNTKKKPPRILYDDMGEPIFLSEDDEENEEETELLQQQHVSTSSHHAAVSSASASAPPPYNPSWLASLSSPPPVEEESRRTPFREPAVDRRTRTPAMIMMNNNQTQQQRPALMAITTNTRNQQQQRHSYDDDDDDEQRKQNRDSMSLSTRTSNSSSHATRRSSLSTRATNLYGESLLNTTTNTMIHQDQESSMTSTNRSILSGVAADENDRHLRPPPKVSFCTTNLLMEEGRAQVAASMRAERKMSSTVEEQQQQNGGVIIPWIQKQWRSNVYPTLQNASQTTWQELQHWSHRMRRRNSNHHDDDDDDDTDLLDHLSYLQQVHKEKVGRMTQVDYDDHYDFAIILQPQAVYAYWADLLDFRQEVLGEESVWDTDAGGLMSPQTQGTEESEASTVESHDGQQQVSVIDARPFLPSTGMRQRRNRGQSPALEAPRTAPSTTMRQEMDGIFSSGGIPYSSGRPVRRTRTSIFQQAVGLRHSVSGSRLMYDADDDEDYTPPPGARTPPLSSTTNLARRRWGTAAMSAGHTPTPNRGSGTPLSSSATRVTPTARRRWGASQTPVRSTSRRSVLSRGSSARASRRRATHVVMPPSSSRESVSDDEVASGSNRRRRNPNSIRIDDIPRAIVPRGILARTYGMEEFLSALKRGIVVRRHRPGATAVLIKLFSTDGGDTINYQIVDEEEAVREFHYQRFRYNKKIEDDDFVERSESDPVIPEEELPTLPLSDCVAAMEQRQKIAMELERKNTNKENDRRVPKKVADIAFKVANSGILRIADVIAVQPAQHEDPRSSDGETGTASLRKSKTEYHAPFTFSIVTKVGRPIVGKTVKSKIAAARSEKWYSGEGKDSQFKSFDMEAATEGEYWLVFRGFLLLHRDAASNRFAQQRNAGFGSNVNSSDIENNLQEDKFKEPPTVRLLEKMIVKIRGLDDSYMQGYVMPGATPPPSSDFLGFRSPGTEIWSRLRLALFQTQRIYGLDKTRVMIKVRCPSDRITDLAEVLRLKLRTREGKLALFREDNIANYLPLNDELDSPSFLGEASLFRSSDRQTIIDYIIRSRVDYSGAGLGQATEPLVSMIQKRVPLHMHAKLDKLFSSWFYFWNKENWIDQKSELIKSSGVESHCHDGGTVASDYPSEQASLVSVRPKQAPNFLIRLFAGSFQLPLDDIEQYFGEQVAFYFAWLQHCSFHLLFLSFAGIIVFIVQLATDHWDHPIRPYFATIVMLWSFVVLVNWRKRSNYLAYNWGTMDYKEQETTRPQFRGTLRDDEITGEKILYYPPWKRWLKYAVSFPIILAFTFGSLVLILLVHANRDNMLAQYFKGREDGDDSTFEFTFSLSSIGKLGPLNAVQLTKEVFKDPTFWFITIGLPALLGLFLPLLNFILTRVSVALNDFENYRTETEYRTHLIIKVFSFRFVCYFATLYYYAFISVGTTQAIENGILRVGTGVFVYITVVHWWGVFLQVFFPLLIYRTKLWMQRKQLKEELRQIEIEEAELVAAEAESSRDGDQNSFKKSEFDEKRVRLINQRLLLDQAQDDIWLETMLPIHDSFPEYIQAVVLFAYATCFSVVLPIAPLICLMNHLISMRLDAYKLCRGRARPLAQKTGGIGVWEHVLHIVTVIAVLTNCWLMGFASSQLSNLADRIGNLALFCIVVGWEHVMLLIKYVMQTSISKLPQCVEDEMKREQFKETMRVNTAMRSKSGRRSQFARSSRLSNGDQSRLSVASQQGSVGTEHHQEKDPIDDPNRGGGLRAIPSGDETDGSTLYSLHHQRPSVETVVSAVPEETTSEHKSAPGSGIEVPTPCRLEMGSERTGEAVSRVSSPFEMYVPSQSFESPSIAASPRRMPDSGNLSGLLGKTLDDDVSLDTPVGSFAQRTDQRTTEEDNAAAAERIQTRLMRLEKRHRLPKNN